MYLGETQAKAGVKILYNVVSKYLCINIQSNLGSGTPQIMQKFG